ncbi:MAG: hypothetical protein ABFD18_09715 [Syntrophomonas sp.]
MRTLVATALGNSKGKKVYCAARKVSDQQIEILRTTPRPLLEEAGFTFIKMLSLESPNVKGDAIFYEGHLDDMTRALKNLYK